MRDRLLRVLPLELRANLDFPFQPFAHRLDQREELLLRVNVLDQLLGPGEEQLSELRIRQEWLRNVAARPPPDCAESEAARWGPVFRPSRGPVAFHAER